MPYELLDHQADMGIRGIGSTLEEAFCEGAQAMLATMADVDSVVPRVEYPLRCTAPDIPSLFVEWLNEILYQRAVHDALFACARIDDLRLVGSEWTLVGAAHGELLDPERHELYTEVKAATYSGLAYRIERDQHILQCVIDL